MEKASHFDPFEMKSIFLKVLLQSSPSLQEKHREGVINWALAYWGKIFNSTDSSGILNRRSYFTPFFEVFSSPHILWNDESSNEG